MTTHAPLTRPARAQVSASPTLALARPFAPQPRAADAGPAAHDLGRVSVAPAEAPIQRVQHHNPMKKKHIKKASGRQQVAVSQQALAIKKAQPQGQQISNKEAARLAKAAIRAQNG